MIERFLSATEMACASFCGDGNIIPAVESEGRLSELAVCHAVGQDEPVVETIIGGRPWAAMVQPVGISSARGTARWTCRSRPFGLDVERNGASRSARTAMEIGLVPSLTALQRVLPPSGNGRAVSRFTDF